MKLNSMKKMLSVIGLFVLIAATALNFAGCSSNDTPETAAAETTAVQAEAPAGTALTVLGEGAVSFRFTVVDLEGSETAFEIHTDETTVGAALLAVELIAGDNGDYGLYVTSVNGITADWDKDQTYWALYIDGEYAMTGIDTTEINPESAYSLVLTKG